jgi:hypothetical protein
MCSDYLASVRIPIIFSTGTLTGSDVLIQHITYDTTNLKMTFTPSVAMGLPKCENGFRLVVGTSPAFIYTQIFTAIPSTLVYAMNNFNTLTSSGKELLATSAQISGAFGTLTTDSSVAFVCTFARA